MKIGVSGSQCVGKSTLIKALSKDPHLKGYTFVDEIVRSLIKSGVKINKEADHFSQCAILEEHYKNTLRYSELVTDRCVVDAFVYGLYNYLQKKFTYKEHKEHEGLFLSALSEYDHHFYLEPLGFLEEDGVRDIDLAYQAEIDSLFRKVYKKYHIKHTILPKKNTEERLQIIIRKLGF